LSWGIFGFLAGWQKFDETFGCRLIGDFELARFCISVYLFLFICLSFCNSDCFDETFGCWRIGDFDLARFCATVYLFLCICQLASVFSYASSSTLHPRQ